jgi:hypothetical protein
MPAVGIDPGQLEAADLWVVSRDSNDATRRHDRGSDGPVLRRLARDYERDRGVSEAFIRRAAINTMIRRLDRGQPAKRQTRRLLNPPE